MTNKNNKLSSKQFYIAPSILSSDLARLGEEVSDVMSAGGDIVHFDVMDNHYVPNLTFGPVVLKSLKKYLENKSLSNIIDVHLMVEPVDSLVNGFAEAGANMVSFHPEASKHIDRTLELIKSYGMLAGLAFNPASSIDCLEYVLDKIDFVLVMSVNPGFGGQKFIKSSLDKIKKIKSIINSSKFDISISVDGGIGENNIAEVAAAGANMFVAGSAIFGQKNSLGYKKVIDQMKENLKK